MYGVNARFGAFGSVLRLRRRFQMLAGEGRELAQGLSDFAAMKISTGRAMRMHEDYVTGYPIAVGAENLFVSA